MNPAKSPDPRPRNVPDSTVSRMARKNQIPRWQQRSLALALMAGWVMLAVSMEKSRAMDFLFMTGLSTVILAAAVLAWILVKTHRSPPDSTAGVHPDITTSENTQ